MNTTSIRPRLFASTPLIAAGLCLLLSGGCGKNVEDSRDGGEIQIPEGTNLVRIEIEKGSLSVYATEDGGPIRWEAAVRKGATKPEDLPLLADVSTDLRVVESDVPGELRIEGPKVPMALAERDRGAVVAMKIVLHIPKELGVTLRTERGPVGVQDRTGPIDIMTKAGVLKLTGNSGYTKAFSGGGGHTVLDHRGGLDVATAHGDFLIYIDELSSDGIKVHTDSGSVQCNLPPGSSFDFEGSTSMGEIESRFELLKETVKRGQKQMGRVGQADDAELVVPKVVVSTKRGNMSVRRVARDAVARD